VSLAVLVVLWLIAAGSGGLSVFSSERSPVPGTYDHLAQTEEFDVVRSVKFSFRGREHRIVIWRARVKGIVSLSGVQQE
jgi:hypothetical protein